MSTDDKPKSFATSFTEPPKPNHRRNGKFKQRNLAALRDPNQGVLDVRGELFRSAQQQALWSQACDFANYGRERPLSLQDWIRQTLDFEARRLRAKYISGLPTTPAVGISPQSVSR